MEANQNNEEWISVSEMAKRLGCTKQTVYNKIARKEYQTKEFSRGSMRGLLIRVPSSNPMGV